MPSCRRQLSAELLQVGPGGFRIDVIRSQWRDPAEVVNTRLNDGFEGLGDQVGRRLNVHFRSKYDPGHRYGPAQVFLVRLSRPGHQGIGLGAEILDDYFLDVAVFFVHIPQRQQGLDALQPCFTDTDQDTGCKWHFRLAGQGDGFQAPGRNLVRRTMMRHAFFAQPVR